MELNSSSLVNLESMAIINGILRTNNDTHLNHMILAYVYERLYAVRNMVDIERLTNFKSSQLFSGIEVSLYKGDLMESLLKALPRAFTNLNLAALHLRSSHVDILSTNFQYKPLQFTHLDLGLNYLGVKGVLGIFRFARKQLALRELKVSYIISGGTSSYDGMIGKGITTLFSHPTLQLLNCSMNMLNSTDLIHITNSIHQCHFQMLDICRNNFSLESILMLAAQLEDSPVKELSIVGNDPKIEMSELHILLPELDLTKLYSNNTNNGSPIDDRYEYFNQCCFNWSIECYPLNVIFFSGVGFGIFLILYWMYKSVHDFIYLSNSTKVCWFGYLYSTINTHLVIGVGICIIFVLALVESHFALCRLMRILA